MERENDSNRLVREKTPIKFSNISTGDAFYYPRGENALATLAILTGRHSLKTPSGGMRKERK